MGDGDRTEFPVIPLGDTVMFPVGMRTFMLGRPEAQVLVESLSGDMRILLVAEMRPTTHAPELADLHKVATLSRIHTWTRTPDGRAIIILAEGLSRVRILGGTSPAPFVTALVEELAEIPAADGDPEVDAYSLTARRLLADIISHTPSLSNDLLPVIAGLKSPGEIADFAGSSLPSLSVAARQQLLEELDAKSRLRKATEEILKERERQSVLDHIQSEAHQRFVGAQKAKFLREEIEAIRHELGEDDENGADVQQLRKRLEEARLPGEVRAETLKELDRLGKTPWAAPDYAVSRAHLEWVLSLPWGMATGTPPDVNTAQRMLDEDHHDLEQPKVRIVEHIAVLQLKRDIKAPILCFTGPPGVGKTSLGKSIARALGRRFVRISVGGVHDEAEIRGHRRTYIGALPGQVMQAIRRAGSCDPVFMIDEIDKLGHDYRGDPAAALLEVLDPEQNYAFRDHYLEVPFDLSGVLFVVTANVLDPVPPALRDRMEVVELHGYSEEDKLVIARRFLFPRQLDANGLHAEQIRMGDQTLLELIRSYTREAGVRNLERTIGSICRKQAKVIAAGGVPTVDVSVDQARTWLGVPHFLLETELEERTRTPGVSVGLAWTPTGGDILYIEALKLPRHKGELVVTGNVGDVMQESARAAWSWMRGHAVSLGIDPRALNSHDVHVHVPAGAVPKDGPSAGLAIAAALVSAFSGRPLRPWVALTGEITLTGQVLPVGGIKEKVLAARASGVREVILPAKNAPELMQDVSAMIRDGLEFHLVRTLDEALRIALSPSREALRVEPVSSAFA
jgi:ATP-dependent Lon protease